MQMFTPQRAIVGAKEIVVFDDSMLIVCTRHG
jgi:hypothetical protein